MSRGANFPGKTIFFLLLRFPEMKRVRVYSFAPLFQRAVYSREGSCSSFDVFHANGVTHMHTPISSTEEKIIFSKVHFFRGRRKRFPHLETAITVLKVSLCSTSCVCIEERRCSMGLFFHLFPAAILVQVGNLTSARFNYRKGWVQNSSLHIMT